MAHYMPPAMLAMFAPRPPLEYLEPIQPKRSRPLTGLAAFKDKFKDPSELKPLVKHETAPEKRARRAKKCQEKAAKRILVQSKKWNPHQNNDTTDDAYKTLFIARLDYNVTEEDMKKEMSTSGPVKSVKLIKDTKTGKPRGYAFIEFEDEKDLKRIKDAYKAQDGKKVLDRRILVDVERGRTVPNWKPRRLGGGLGSTRKGDKKKKGAGASAPLRREESSRSDRRSSGDFRKEPPRDNRDRDRVRDRERDRDRNREDRHRDDRHRDDRNRDRDYRGRDRERERERDRPRSYREPSSRSARERDDRRSSSGLPTNGPPLPPQSAMF